MRGTRALLCAALLCALPAAEGKGGGGGGAAGGGTANLLMTQSVGRTGGRAYTRNPDKHNRHDTAWKIFVVVCVVLAMWCALHFK